MTRAHEETDVEDLYQYVSVGTPVTVYYDRLVIDVDPDAYGFLLYLSWRLRLAVHEHRSGQRPLAGYGVEDFADFQDIR